MNRRWSILCCVFIAMSLVNVAAQGRAPQPSNDPAAAVQRQGTLQRVNLLNGRLRTCQGEQCLKVKLEDLGTDVGLHFRSIPDAGRKLSGVWCTCDLKQCKSEEAWSDDNPLSGSSPVKVNARPNVLSDIRRFNNHVWAIQWHSPGATGATTWTSEYVFVSTAPLTDSVFSDRKVVIRCDPVKAVQ